MRKSMRRRRGAAGVEYGLLVGLVAVAAIATVSQTGTRVGQLFDLAANRLGGPEPDVSAPADSAGQTPPADTGNTGSDGSDGSGGDGGSTADLAFSPATLRYSPMGCSVSYLHNNSAVTHTVSLTGAGGDLSVLYPLCPPAQAQTVPQCGLGSMVLAPGASCYLGFSANSYVTEDRAGYIAMTDGDLEARLDLVADASVPAPHNLQVDQTAEIPPDTCTPIAVTNSGASAIRYTHGSVSGDPDFRMCDFPDTSYNQCNMYYYLQPGASCNLGVRYDGKLAGSGFATTLTVESYDSAPATVSVTSSRASDADPDLDWDYRYDNLQLSNATACVPVNVTNNGGPTAGTPELLLTTGYGAIQPCTPSGTGHPVCNGVLGNRQTCSLGVEAIANSNATYYVRIQAPGWGYSGSAVVETNVTKF